MIVPAKQDGGPDLPEGLSWHRATSNDDGTYTVEVRPEDAPLMRWHLASHTERAQIRRREHEEAGITLTIPGMGEIEIPTGRPDRAIMDGALLMLRDERDRTIRWRATDGTRVPVTYDSLRMINRAVWEYVEACFDREAEIADDPDADMDAGWPSRERTLG